MDRVDLGGSTGAKKKAYIILPPKDGALLKSSRIMLDQLGVDVRDELPLIGGYTASLTSKHVKELEKKGFSVFSDEQDRFIPVRPWERVEKNEETQELGTKAGEKLEKFLPRPELEGPRFAGPLGEKFQGEGISIAVLDTGLYPHPDFIFPQTRIVGWVDMVEGRTVPYDDNGHGTHVAGDAAGNGHQSGGLYRGTAPMANLVGIKVLSGEGSGKTSDIIKGLAWAIAHKDQLNIRVINMSLGHEAQKKLEDDPIDQAVQKAVEAGIVVVAAAGNDGPERKTIAAPGDSPFALTVGAVDDWNTADRSDDIIAPFSSRGPTPAGLVKPDIVAPGEAIIAPNSPGTGSEALAKRMGAIHETVQWLSALTPEQLGKVPDAQFAIMGLAPETVAKIKEGPAEAASEFNRLLVATSRMPLRATSYVGMPGTSMATPLVAGVVAQMLEANPNLTPAEVKEILKETAEKLPDRRLGPNTQGSGMVDPEEAIAKALFKAIAGSQPAPPAEAQPSATVEPTPAPPDEIEPVDPTEGETPAAPPEEASAKPEEKPSPSA